jgi:hypothetical protein
MLCTRGFSLLLAAASLVFAQDSSHKQLTARELFYAASQPKAATPVKSSTPKSNPAPRPVHTPPKPVEVAAATQTEHRAPAASDAGVRIIPAAHQTAEMPANGESPLGLRINVLRYNSDGTTTDVLPDTIFHSGDRIRLSVETNARGHLYIANQGTSGTWKAMFPSSEIEGGDNRVEAMRPTVVPPGNHVFTFDTTVGKENLFVVFSRQPVTDFEELVYQLGTKKPASNTAPKSREDKQLIMASNIGDPAISRLRSAYGRDLIIETVNPSNPAPAGAKPETAVYVVNPSGSPDSRVVADIKLVHQ